MLTVFDLTFSYSANATFSFPDFKCTGREALLITGNSGKGKTTLLHILGGLMKPDTGSVQIGQVKIETLPEPVLDKFRGKNIGIVLQQPHFIESLSVIENVVLASWLATGKKDYAHARTLLGELGLSAHQDKPLARLSIGQQQRVSIARALVNKPKLLLADEPTSSLDDENTAIVAGLLQTLASETGSALVIVTHDHRLKQIFKKTIDL